MPATGKHRRSRSRTFTRGFIVAGTGGAAIALPLIGATGAHAAANAAPVVAPAKVSAAVAPGVAAAPSSRTQTVAERVADSHRTAARTTYSVVPGDYLAKIAREQHVRGGWQRVYAANREAVGVDPSLIHPGLKLVINGKAAEGNHPAAPAPAVRKSSLNSSKPDSSSPDPSKAGPSTPVAPKTAAAAAQGNPLAAVAGAAQNGASGFTTPLETTAVGTPYGVPGSMWASGHHTGVDFLAATGTPVRAVGAGTVVTAGWGGSYGNQVVIRHSDGHYSQYAHLSSLSVSAGEPVDEGQRIGLSGSTGNATGPHLHFEIRTGPDYGSDIDPLTYLRDHGVQV